MPRWHSSTAVAIWFSTVPWQCYWNSRYGKPDNVDPRQGGQCMNQKLFMRPRTWSTLLMQ